MFQLTRGQRTGKTDDPGNDDAEDDKASGSDDNSEEEESDSEDEMETMTDSRPRKPAAKDALAGLSDSEEVGFIRHILSPVTVALACLVKTHPTVSTLTMVIAGRRRRW